MVLQTCHPEYWDIPGGGSVEEDELPREGAVREAMEEVNQRLQLVRFFMRIAVMMIQRAVFTPSV